MKAFIAVLGAILLIGLLSIKAAVAITFLGSCTAICLWINRKVKVPNATKSNSVEDEALVIESYDGVHERYTLY